MEPNNTPNGYWQNAKGDLVAVENIKEIDKLRHEFVLEKAQEISAMNASLASLKQNLFDEIQAFTELSFERYDIKLGGKKGNVCLTSFDGEYKLERSINEYLTFDEGLQAAKHLIDECLREWTKDEAGKIQTLINHAFRVDKKGKINTATVLSLRTLKIDDSRWALAMDAISDSLKVAGSSTYVRLYKKDKYDKYQPIPLDIAAV